MLKPYKRRQIHYKGIGTTRPDPSVLDTPRSNQCSERSIKVIQEIYYMCKNKDKLQLRFILSKKRLLLEGLMLCLFIFAWYNNSQSKCVKVK